MIPTKMNNRDVKKRKFFREGDFVNFELDEEMVTYRYHNGNDYGGSGEYENGIIQRKTQEFIEVAAIMPDGKLRNFKVANYSHEKYDHRQWFKPGFMVKWEKDHLDINCECGYGNESNLHFLFCPRHPKGNNVPTKEQLEEKLMEMKWCTEYSIEEARLKLSMGS